MSAFPDLLESFAVYFLFIFWGIPGNEFLPEIIVVSGDIAYSGLKEEYQLAFSFLNDLLKVLKLTKDKIFLVPGNHDLDIREYRPSDIPGYLTMKELNTELENL